MTVTELLSAVDILDYVSQYCEFEEKNGEYWALSPLKPERTPSFSINKDKQLFYDFSSGSGGNVVDFVTAYEGCDVRTALRKIADYAGIEPGTHFSGSDLDIVRIAKKYAAAATKKPADERPPVLPSGYMQRYEFRKDKLQPWLDEGIGIDSLRKFGVMYDPFSDRIVYPVRNYEGGIVNICGRTLDPLYKEHRQRKYTYFFKNGNFDILFGYHENIQHIRKQDEVIVFEGAKSVMLADTWGIHNAVCLSTSHLSYNQMLKLISTGVRVVFALDEDVDISKDDNIKKLCQYVRVEAVRDRWNLLQPKMAPVDAGMEVWQTLYEGRRRLN